MCVDNDSRPPITPIAGGSAGGKDLKLTASDGTKFMAYTARAAKPTGAGMVVIPDVRGLHVYYKELADRFAEVGVDAVAIDFFARTAPSDDRGESFDFMSHVPHDLHDIIEKHDFEKDMALRRALVERGVFFVPVATKQCSISAAHTAEDIDFTLAQLDAALGSLTS